MSIKNQIYEIQQPVKATTASISCFASTLIAIMILRSNNGLKSPYSRIIFGLSIADIIQSASMIISPFAVPSDSTRIYAPWAKGTIDTCEAAGFFLHIGGNAVPFYTLFLSYYFLKRVKDKITPQEFARKFEFKIHAFIWLFAIIGGFVALARNDFNPTMEGSLCIVIDHPVDCSTDPDTYGTCIRGQHANIDTALIIGVPSALNFLLLVANLVRLTMHVHSQERLMRDEATSNSSDVETNEGYLVTAILCCCKKNQSDLQDQDNAAPTQSLAMQSLVQSSLYIFAYFLTYSFPILHVAMRLAGVNRPPWMLIIGSIFWPLGGLFNILIYTRPKVSAVRIMRPEFAHSSSWFRIFLLVVISGGEVPTDDNFEDESSHDENGNESENGMDANRYVY